VYGKRILQYKIDNAANPEEKETLVRDLMKLYDQYHKNFPEHSQDYEVSKAMALHDNNIEAKDEIFTLLNSAFTKAPNSITNANAIYLYFTEYHAKFLAGDSKITADAVLDTFDNACVLLNQLSVSNPKKDDEYKTAFRAINLLVKEIATCENLEVHYKKGYEKNKENTDWLLAAVTNMFAKCGAQPVFFTLTQQLHALKPSVQSAYFMGVASLKKKDFIGAIQYYNQSADLQTNPVEKARIYYNIATTLVGNDNAKSKEYLQKALSFDATNGKVYIYLSQLYANTANECGATDFEKKAIYYLAAQTVKKAETASPKLKPAVDQMFTDFKSKAPSAAEISKQKLNGKSFTIKCWINETIQFPEK
jgi:tetratricopeptide (TPR) repeat protein